MQPQQLLDRMSVLCMEQAWRTIRGYRFLYIKIPSFLSIISSFILQFSFSTLLSSSSFVFFHVITVLYHLKPTQPCISHPKQLTRAVALSFALPFCQPRSTTSQNPNAYKSSHPIHIYVRTDQSTANEFQRIPMKPISTKRVSPKQTRTNLSSTKQNELTK